MKPLEILAPVGNFEMLEAALEAGCDAIYCAMPQFGARAYAHNFTAEEMGKVIARCHSLDVKVHVTMNTLLFEHEIEQAYQQAKMLYEMGADALIVQDLGLIKLLHDRLPDLCIHASTQLSITSPKQIEQCKQLGISRVVLARECTKEQVEACVKMGLEIEVFVHGALCICYSGQCLFSSLVYGRSGNRGQCAQPCRMPYHFYQDGKEIKIPGDYLLSPKDLSLIEQVKELQALGVCSVKIEGRMKSKEYVYEAVKLVRQVRDGKSLSRQDRKDVKVTFNRGFTKGHLFSQKGQDLMNMSTSNHQGILIGEVLYQKQGRIQIRLKEVLHQNDAIRIVWDHGEWGGYVNYIYDASGRLISQGNPGQVIFIPSSEKIPFRSKVLKTIDSSLQKEIEQNLKTEHRHILVACHLTCLGPGHPLICTFTHGEYQGQAQSKQEATEARSRPLNKEDLIKQFSKTKDTFVKVSSFDFDLEGSIFFPLSELNHVRKQAILDLYQKMTGKRKVKERKEEGTLSPIFLDAGITVVTPYTKKDPEFAGLNYNLTNSYALACLLQLGFKGAMLSLECSFKDACQLKDAFEKRYGFCAPISIFGYGKRRLMLMNHCVVNTVCKDGKRQGCSLCHQHIYQLKGKDGGLYRLLGDAHCRMQIFEEKAYDIREQLPDYMAAGFTHFHLFFLDEEQKNQEKIIQDFDF